MLTANPLSCLLCGSQEWEMVSHSLRDSDEGFVARCLSCDLVQKLPHKAGVNSVDNSGKIGMAYNPEELRKHYRQDTKRRLEYITRHYSPYSRVLDFGCGYGFLINELIDRGYDAFGIEINQAKLAKASNTRIVDCDIAVEKLALGSFDVVTMFHVLEHLSDPVKYLAILLKILKPNGVLIIEVPNFNDWMLKVNKGYRDFYFQEAHIIYFTNITLQNLLLKAGYQGIKIDYVQRYGLGNMLHWFRTGKPQLKNPDIKDDCNSSYLEYLSAKGITDTLFARCLNPEGLGC